MKKRDAWLWSREQLWLRKNANIILLANQKIIQNYRINSDSWCQRNWLKGITHILVTGWETIRFQLKGLFSETVLKNGGQVVFQFKKPFILFAVVLHYLRAWTNVNKLSANYFAIACQDVPVSMPTQEGEQSFLIVLHQPKIKRL